MALTVTSYTIAVGTAQQLELAQGEDREFRLTFQETSGSAVDLTGAQAVVLTVKNRSTGILVFARNYTGFQGAATAGTPRFQVLAADTDDLAEAPYDVDVTWTDASGYKRQLLVLSTFLLLRGVGEPGDALTTPPAIPVVYGLTWLGEWTGKSGGWNLNDAVYAYDGSLGATAVSTFRAAAQGVTHHPITGTSQVVASGWAYIGQHGAVGATGPAGGAGAGGSTALAVYATGSSHGVLSLGFGLQGTTGTDAQIFKLYQPNEQSCPAYTEYVVQFDNVIGTEKNQVRTEGWNLNTTGRISPSRASFGTTLEYLYQPNTFTKQSEWYLQAINEGGSGYRPIQVNAPHGITLGPPIMQLQVNSFSLLDPNSSTTRWRWAPEDGGAVVIPSAALASVFEVQRNNTVFLTQYNPTGTAITLLRYTSTGILELGTPTTAPVAAYDPKLRGVITLQSQDATTDYVKVDNIGGVYGFRATGTALILANENARVNANNGVGADVMYGNTYVRSSSDTVTVNPASAAVGLVQFTWGGGVARWKMDASEGSALQPGAHNTYNFGSSGSAVRRAYFADYLSIGAVDSTPNSASGTGFLYATGAALWWVSPSGNRSKAAPEGPMATFGQFTGGSGLGTTGFGASGFDAAVNAFRFNGGTGTAITINDIVKYLKQLGFVPA